MTVHIIIVPPTNPCPKHPGEEAGNCWFCGEKKLPPKRYNAAFDTQGNQRNIVPEFKPLICPKHSMPNFPHGCFKCEAERYQEMTEAEANRRLVDAINSESKQLWKTIRDKESAARWAGGKCSHGHYLYEEYCNVCSIKRIDPDYDVDLYRDTINKALRNAKAALGGLFRADVRDYNKNCGVGDEIKLTEQQKNFAEIESMVDMEVWRATKKYGSEMNERRAYAVARNVAGKFLSDLIEETTIFEGLDFDFMTPEDREAADKLLKQCDEVQGLEQLAKDRDAKPEDRETAKRLMKEYGRRSGRFKSLDERIEEDDDTSPAEWEIHQQEARERTIDVSDVADALEEQREKLRRLLPSLRGKELVVGKAMLSPDFQVSKVPGVDKSSVSRIRKVILGKLNRL